MSTQAKDVLKHTFQQLEEMLKEVRRQEIISRNRQRPGREMHAGRKGGPGGPGKKK